MRDRKKMEKAFAFANNFMMEGKEEKARNSMLKFLKGTMDIYNLKSKIIKYYLNAVYFQRKFKNYLKRYQRRV